MGRFLSQDPWEGAIDTPPSLHRYLFAYQNPTVWWDPDGRQPEQGQARRLLEPGEQAPPGWIVTLLDPETGLRSARPPAPQQQEEPEREPSWWEKATDRVTESVRRLGAALESFKETEQRSRDTRPSTEKLEAAVAEGRDPGEVYRDPLRAVGELTEATGEVVAASADLALDAAEGTGWAGLVKSIGRKGIQRLLGSKSGQGTRQAAKQTLMPRVRQGTGGRVESAVAKIEPQHLGGGTGTTSASRSTARQLGVDSDDAGHLIANRLGGPGGVGYVVPQNPHVNRGVFREFERQIAEEVRAGKEVFVRVVPRYRGSSTRPYEIVYQVRVDGKTTAVTFPNPP